jgi:quinol monooxygenase YgiN
MSRDPKLIVIAEIHGLAGRAAELSALLAGLAHATADEPGCVAFRLLEPGTPGEFVVVGEYSDEPALRAHYATDHYRYYRASVGELLARPSDVVVHHVAQTVRAVDPNLPDPGMLG